MFFPNRIINALAASGAEAWLFYNYQHRDKLADKILEIAQDKPNTRPWIYLYLKKAEPLKFVHVIEDSILDHLPGKKLLYNGRQDLSEKLKSYSTLALNWLANYSLDFPRLSFLDFGAVLYLNSLGFKLQSAENAIKNLLSTISGEELEMHRQASIALHQIIKLVWAKIQQSFNEQKIIFEGDILEWLQEYFSQFGLVTEWPLIVASGPNTIHPHYSPVGKGRRLKNDEVLQLDIWGKKNVYNGIYADISWVGYLAKSVPPRIKQVFKIVKEARDSAVTLLKESFKIERAVTGAQLDQHVENFIKQAGLGDYLKHRSGHSLDTEVHGYGVNLDSREFPDNRFLENGACFSIEPGIYLNDFGIRSEINIYIENNIPEISGGEPQLEFLLL